MLKLICRSTLARYLLFIFSAIRAFWNLRLIFRFCKCTSRNYTWNLWTPSVQVACITLSLSLSLLRAQLIYTRVAWRDTRHAIVRKCRRGTRARDLAQSSRSLIRSATATKNAGHFPNVYNEYALTAAWVMRLRPRKGVIFARRWFPPSLWRRIIFCRSSTKNGIRDGDDNKREKHAVFSVVKLFSLFFFFFLRLHRNAVITNFSGRDHKSSSGYGMTAIKRKLRLSRNFSASLLSRYLIKNRTVVVP